MDNDQTNSFAVGVTSREAGYATPQEKPKQEEQKQSKSKPIYFSLASTWQRDSSSFCVDHFWTIDFIPFFAEDEEQGKK